MLEPQSQECQLQETLDMQKQSLRPKSLTRQGEKKGRQVVLFTDLHRKAVVRARKAGYPSFSALVNSLLSDWLESTE